MVDLYTLSVVAFFAILGVLIYKDRKNIEFKYILFMRRTNRFTSLIDRAARISPRFWKIIGSIAVVVCFITMAYGTFVLIQTDYLVYKGILNQPGLQIALPIPSSEMAVGPGYIGIPFWFWIITIAIILIPHEAMHGIIARAEKIKLKNVGLFLLAIFPGAFVEPDEKQVKKASLMTKLRIFAAGTFINLTIGFTVMLLAQGLIWVPNTNGVVITNVNSTSPAGYAGIQNGTIIHSIGGQQATMGFNDYSFLVLTMSNSTSGGITNVLSSLIIFRSLSAYNPGDNITLETNAGNYNITLAEHPQIKDFPYIGIGSALNVKDPSLFLFAFPLLGMIAALSIFVGLFNILPIYPLDGGLMFQSVTEKYFKKNSKKIVKAVMIIMAIIIAYGIVGSYLNDAIRMLVAFLGL
jgi:membrane-associated protease RseP (regulator of RpoE activity)